jgi:hypothetical protein
VHTSNPNQRHEFVPSLKMAIPGAIMLFALVVYWMTLQPGLSGGDSAEAQFVPYTLGIMHFTGYPLYTILGYLWSHIIIIGDVAYRMNLLSAVAGAAAVASVASVTFMLGRNWFGGVFSAVLLGVSTLFWDWSTKAGVRSMNVMFIVGIIGLAIAWSRRQTNHAGATNRFWLGLWFVVGLSLAHHRTTILLLPGLVVYVVWTRFRLLREWRAILTGALMLLPGLLTYVYPLWRGANHPAYQALPVDNFEHFLDLVLARNLSDMVTAITWQQVPERLGWFVEYIGSQFGNAGIVVSIIGLVLLMVRHPREGVLVWLFLLLLTAFTIDYRIEGMAKLNNVFLLPVNMIVSIGAGYLLGTTLHWSHTLSMHRSSKENGVTQSLVGGTVSLLAILALAVPMATQSLAWVYTGVEQPLYAYREELRGEQANRLTSFSEELVQPRPVIVGEWEQVAAFWYQQLVEHRWLGAELHFPVISNLGLYIDQAWQSGREIYLIHAVPGLGNGRQLSMAGALVHVMRHPETEVPTHAVQVNAIFADGLSLVGYRLYTDTLRTSGVLPVSVYWRAQRVLTSDDSISIRLQQSDGTQVAQEDAVHPVLGSFPTTHWTPGSVVGDYYELALPAKLPPGDYRLSVVVYQRQADGSTRNVRNQTTGQELTQFGALTVPANR